MATTFRFQTLKVWHDAAGLSFELFALADALEQRRRYKFAEQLRSAVLSITNNIAEGSGSGTDREFAQFVNYARRSTFEVVNMLLIFRVGGLVTESETQPWITSLEALSRGLERLRQTLLRRATEL